MSFLGIDISGDRSLASKLGQLVPAVEDDGVEFANEYIIRIMREYAPNMPPITRSGALSGRKPYRRTQTLRRNWKKMGAGKNQIVVNETPYGKYVMGSGTQSRVMAMRGWTTEKQRVEKRRGNIVRKYNAGVIKAIRRLGLDG